VSFDFGRVKGEVRGAKRVGRVAYGLERNDAIARALPFAINETVAKRPFH
jgi:hypothetical protein